MWLVTWPRKRLIMSTSTSERHGEQNLSAHSKMLSGSIGFRRFVLSTGYCKWGRWALTWLIPVYWLCVVGLKSCIGFIELIKQKVISFSPCHIYKHHPSRICIHFLSLSKLCALYTLFFVALGVAWVICLVACPSRLIEVCWGLRQCVCQGQWGQYTCLCEYRGLMRTWCSL